MQRDFKLKTRLTPFIALAACLLVGLTVDTNGAGSSSATPVKVTLLNVPGDRIRSDGKTYVDGIDKVSAVIHDNGKLDVYSGSHTKADRRDVVLDYSDVDYATGCNRQGDPGLETPLNCDKVPDPNVSKSWARLHSFADLNLLTMAPGAVAWGGFAVAFYDGCSEDWVIAFQNDGTEWEHSCGPLCSAQVKVEAFDNDSRKGVAGTGVDTWIISAEISDPDSAHACLWSGHTGVQSTAVLREIVRMPFHLVVELK